MYVSRFDLIEKLVFLNLPFPVPAKKHAELSKQQENEQKFRVEMALNIYIKNSLINYISLK